MKRQDPAPTRVTILDAMKQTGTTTPKQALAKLNEGRRGRKRYAMCPLPPNSPGKAKERARRAKRLAKGALDPYVP